MWLNLLWPGEGVILHLRANAKLTESTILISMTDEDLIAAAVAARKNAYAPYSGFCVGAAILAATGQFFTGTNVENISFGLTICAERVALSNAVQSGVTKFVRIAIATDLTEPTVPCGACRQVLAEFSPSLEILSWTLSGQMQRFDLSSLLPLAGQGILK